MASSVTGVQETIRAFKALAALMAPALNSASKHSLEPMLEDAKSLAPIDTGTLRRSLVIRRVRASPKNNPQYRVGPNPATKGKDGRRPVKYAHLVEFGLGPVKRAQPFLTAAFETNKAEAIERFGKLFGPALEKSAARLAARKAK
jgi:HK97 gp10 family phage protein